VVDWLVIVLIECCEGVVVFGYDYGGEFFVCENLKCLFRE